MTARQLKQPRVRTSKLGFALIVLLTGFVLNASAKEIPLVLPDPDTKPPATDKPVKVYVLSGQSNMVGIGQVSGGTVRWSGVSGATVSVYPGAYSPTADYDELEPTKTKKLPVYGGVKPTPFPGGGTQVVSGFIEIKTAGVYKFNPGYQASTSNIMELDGVEVHRKEVGKDAVHTGFKITGGKKYPFKITFLTKAAGGLGWYWRTDIPGTLNTVVNVDGKFSNLVDKRGNWTVRNDVWYKGLVTATANKWLSVGCGAGSNQIGPELQFGYVMGYFHDEPVIILKTSQGNRSLGWDFLPPGGKRFTFEGRTYAGYKDDIPSWTADDPGKKVNWYAGLQYDQCFKAAHEVLDNFATHFPQYKDQGYEITGFVWWQGHKDGNPAHASRYEQNLVHLIKSLRKEFKAPKAPFVIGTIGFGGWKMAGPHLTVAKAQLAVSGEKGKYPEFAGNVLTVETRDFWKEASISPRNQGFHYNGNAETYMMVGDALGRGMVKLLEKAE
ncbi:MAG: sialate O-acetylesterase [Pirellulales bacterium]